MPPTPLTELPLVEVFSSLQGEGPWLGVRQVFVRLAGCNLACAYCDTQHGAADSARVEKVPGSGQFRTVANPVALETLTVMLEDWTARTPGLHHSLSLTGGEPLIHAPVLQDWLPVLRSLLPIYLETNGTLPEALEPLLPHIDVLSMDLKLPSLTGVPARWDAHRRFLRLAWSLPGYVKVVVAETTPREELEAAAEVMAQEAENRDLVLQPLTRNGAPAVSIGRLMELQRLAAAIHPRVRVIPQVHPLLGAL